MFPKELRKNGFKTLTVKIKHLHVLQALSRHHGDPFDRMLIAQAKAESMPVITVDPEFHKYDIQVIW